MLFEEDISLGQSNASPSIKDYLVNVPEFKASIDKGNIAPNPEFFSKENLSKVPGMEWLNHVKPILFAAPVEDPQQQREILNKFVETLKSEAVVEIDGTFSPAFPEDMPKEKVLALDLETTGLDTRTKYTKELKLDPQTKIVGVSLAMVDDKGYYLPVKHTEEDGYLNWDYEVIIEFLTRLNQEFFTVNHNAQYDREIMALNGVELRPFPYFVDTLIVAFLQDSNRKSNGLKVLSETLLSRKMVEIHELFSEKKKKNLLIEFEKLPACNSYIYAASDAMNTFGLMKYFATQPDNPFNLQHVPLEIDHKMIDVLRNLYRAGVPIDFDYCLASVKDVAHRIFLMEREIYALVGRRFDIQSPAQLSHILFDEMKIPVLSDSKRGKPTKAYPTGLYSTAEDDLDKIYAEHPDIPLLEYVVTYRKLQNSASKLFLKMLANSWVDGFLPFTRVLAQYMMSVIPSGRLSSASNKGKEGVIVSETDTGNLSFTYDKGSWTCGFNTQGVTKSSYKLIPAKKIRNLPPESGLGFSDPYGQEVMDLLVKMIAGI